ncbi:hypothetical protein [Alicyclobacillus sp. ALC3]|uniref:hypothetical protein n=1 Tax=Alicyclobacillus sp. ALC3 TaxID=2796143 RepID=UPI0023785ADB|nr:hypothetical protein [Alicyclobacillus sp. ALC3]WDL96417.1 hypothetical protein JC200_19140 [Alicyclobacillus sp. ALC3]
MQRFTLISKRVLYPFYWPFIETEWDRQIIFTFTKWFGGVPGFKQQVLLILGWATVDLAFPKFDPHMLALMAFLTIYSGGTQPGLAIGNEQSMGMLVQLLKNNTDQLKAMWSVIKELQRMRVEDRQLLNRILEALVDDNREAAVNAARAAMKRGEDIGS